MQTPFQALVLTEVDGKTHAQVQPLTQADLPAGDTLVAVSHSSLNYKDAMALTGKGKIVRQFPMVPGIDLVGTVIACTSGAWKAGDAVVLTGWGVAEGVWGGYDQGYARRQEWLRDWPTQKYPRH